MKRKSRATQRTPRRRTRTSSAVAKRTVAPDPTTLVLPAQLDIRTLGKVPAELRRRIAKGRPLTIDGSAVSSIDTAALQLLLAARRAAAVRAITFEWSNASESLRSASRLVGLCAALGLALD